MASLSTSYLGLKLRNPLVVSSSSLTDSVEKLKALEQAGAGAVVLKSLFEEQLTLEARKLDASLNLTEYTSAEAASYFADVPLETGTEQYLKLIERAKAAVSLPVIASLNCLHRGQWGRYARQLESAGADALELNVYAVQTDPERTGAQVEAEYLDLVSEVRAQVKGRLAVKLSPFFSSIPNLVAELGRRGVDAVVLFNRFYQPNLDLEQMTTSSRLQLSRPEDALLALRWIALLHGRIPRVELAATGGVHDGKTALKMLLAGAAAVYVCSTLFKNKEKHLGAMLQEMQAWMAEKGYGSVDELRGVLSQRTCPDPQAFERSQYIKMLVGHD